MSSTGQDLTWWTGPALLLAGTCLLGAGGVPTWVGFLAALTTGIAGATVDHHVRTQHDRQP